MNALLARVDELAHDVGRLRRRLDPDSYEALLAWRIAEHVASLDTMLRPTAAEIYRENLLHVQPDDAVADALDQIDARTAHLSLLLGDRRAA